MKKIIIMLLAVLLVCFASCGAQAKDISGAKSISDLDGARISAQSGTFHAEARTQIKNVKGDLLPDFDSLLTALQSGAIDGYIAEEPTALSVIAKNNNLGYLPFINNDTGFKAAEGDTSIAIGCKKGSELVSKINNVLSTITTQQRQKLMAQIVEVKNNINIDSFVLTNNAPTTTSGTLKVAMECAYDPFNWTQENSENGAVLISNIPTTSYANGYDVQIAKYIANSLGLSLEIHAVEWDSLIPGVTAGTYDAIIAGMSPTDERKEKIDFSDLYYISNLVVIYKKK